MSRFLTPARRAALGGALALTVLTGCGAAADPSVAASSDGTPSAAAPSTAVDTAVDDATVTAVTEADGPTVIDEVDVTPVEPTLSLTGPGGEQITLDAVPERIVCLTGLCDDVLVELGLEPVGTTTPGLLALPQFLGDAATDIPTIPGSFGTEDVAAIAALEPDLVVGLAGAHDQLRNSVEQFAPLWLLDVTEWEDSIAYLRAFAALTDRPTEQVAAETAFRESLQAARTASSEGGLGDLTALTMYASGGGRGVNTSDDLLGGLMSEIFAYPWPNKGGGWDTAQNYSVEEILAVDPQIIFVQSFTSGPDGPTASEELSTNPVWQEISAVRNGKVIEVDTDLWTAGRGPRALAGVLDEAVAAATA